MTGKEIMETKKYLKYGIDCDIFQEPVISYARTALWAFEEVNRQKAEIERLEEMLDCSISSERNSIDNIPYERAKAIKEFAERLKERFFNYYEGLNEHTSKSNYNGETLMFYEVADMIEDCIENLVKEMTEQKGR